MTKKLAVAILVALLTGGAAIAALAQTSGPATRFAFVARGDNPIDALAVAPVAGRMDAPVVLTPPNELVSDAAQALTAASPDVVVLAGGSSALSESVESQIRSAVPGATVRRVSGTNRYATARALGALLSEYDPAFAYSGAAEPIPDDNRGDAVVGQWVFDDVQVLEDGLGDFEARARVTNTGDTADFAFWTITFFSNGSIVGTADASASDVAAGDTITVEFITSDDYVAWDEWDIQEN